MPATNHQQLAKDIRPERSRENFLKVLADMACRETFSNYFLSAAWAIEYISRLPASDFFAGYYLNGGPDAAQSVVYFSQGMRSSPMSRCHLSLGFNEATSPQFDSITTECNGILVNQGAAFAEWIPAILSHMVTEPEWEELRFNALPVADAERLQKAAAELGLLSHVFSSRKTYLTDLALIQDRFGGDFLTSRSANSRQQIRSAIKKIEATYGPLNIERATSTDIAHNWLDLLGELHLKRWNAKGESTGFADPHFVAFHHSLIDGLFQSNQIDLLRVTSANNVVAYLYNFVVDGKAYFNMSGVCYEQFGLYRPGILAHYTAILFYLARKMDTYNFLAGTHRYKESLSTYSETQMNIIVRRPRIEFRVEALLRAAKRLLNA